ncbi:MAG TPA: PRC-barrel domain-containing protein [Asanoa sp.]
MNPLDPQTTEYRTPPSASGGVPTGAFDPWRFRDEAGITGHDLVGYKVEATDGSIGKIDGASHDVNSSYLVVDTGPWIFGKKTMLPAGVVTRVDHEDRKVFVDRSKEQIKIAPEYDAETHTDPAFRDKLGGYYGDTYGTAGPPPRMPRS